MLAIEAILKADTMWGEGRRGTGREKKKRKKILAPAHRNQAVFCDTQKKRGWSPPHQKSRNRTDTLTKLLSVQFLFPYLTGEKRCLS